jgi:hypothetical protein
VESDNYRDLFSEERLEELLPQERTDRFFEALLGDAADGAYDIGLAFKNSRNGQLTFDIQLKQRPGKCLVCNLTYGLPQVFSRHPVIDIEGLVRQIENLLAGRFRCPRWELGATREVNRKLHAIPLIVHLEKT